MSGAEPGFDEPLIGRDLYDDEPFDDEDDCPDCEGSGQVESDRPEWDGFDEDGNPRMMRCHSCNGKGTI